MKDEERCDIRGAGNSFHVGYVLNEPDGWVTQNLTHAASFSDDDLAEDEIEVGWVLETDESPGFAMLQIFEGMEGYTHLLHRMPRQTILQLADMFTLMAARVLEEEEAAAEREAEELAAQIEVARQHQPLPFPAE